MQPKWVQIAEQQRTDELPAEETEVVEALSMRVVSGRELVKSTSDLVKRLTKIISPFQEVWATSPGGNSEMSISL